RLRPHRPACFGAGAELEGWPQPSYLAQKPEGSGDAAVSLRRSDRHWTPVRLDLVVETCRRRLRAPSLPGRVPRQTSRLRLGAKNRPHRRPFWLDPSLIEFLGRGIKRLPDPQRPP